jgi:Flp pilus assembly protein TadB
MREHIWITRSAWFDARPFPVAHCARCGLRRRRGEPLEKGPCQPSVRHRVGFFMGIALTVAALVLSVVISPVIFAGYVAVAIVFGVLQWGWRRLRNQP